MSAPADAATSFISRRRRIIPGPTASARHCFHSASTLYVTRTGIVIRYDTIRDAVLTCTQNRTEPKTKKWERRSSSVEAGTPAVCPRCRSSSRPIFDRRRSDPEPIRSGPPPNDEQRCRGTQLAFAEHDGKTCYFQELLHGWFLWLTSTPVPRHFCLFCHRSHLHHFRFLIPLPSQFSSPFSLLPSSLVHFSLEGVALVWLWYWFCNSNL